MYVDEFIEGLPEVEDPNMRRFGGIGQLQITSSRNAIGANRHLATSDSQSAPASFGNDFACKVNLGASGAHQRKTRLGCGGSALDAHEIRILKRHANLRSNAVKKRNANWVGIVLSAGRRESTGANGISNRRDAVAALPKVTSSRAWGRARALSSGMGSAARTSASPVYWQCRPRSFGRLLRRCCRLRFRR